MWIYFKIQVTKNIHTKTKPFSFNTTGGDKPGNSANGRSESIDRLFVLASGL